MSITVRLWSAEDLAKVGKDPKRKMQEFIDKLVSEGYKKGR